MRCFRLLGMALICVAAGIGFAAEPIATRTTASAAAASTHVGAIGEDGMPVDWWFIYKVPHLSGAGGKDSTTGLEYMYYDKNSKTLVPSKHSLLDGKGALDLTLNAVFQHPSDTTGWILYNDELPESVATKENRKDNGALGHTKGIIAFDTATKTAFWLLHSWPKYPTVDPMDEKPALNFGQTFLCLSLDIDTVRKIAAQMANHQEPQVYLPKIPNSIPKTDPLFLLTQPLNPNAPGDSDALDFKSHGGLPFKVIAKNRKWGKDFWNDLVGPTLKEDMDVETWIRGPIAPTLDNDGIHKTFDIKFVDMRSFGTKWAWPEHADHAKWGITKKNNWVCVGDINRMISQEQRGGGTIAFQNEGLWKALKQAESLVLPTGHTQDDAKVRLKTTHSHKPAGKKPITSATKTSFREDLKVLQP